MFHKGAMFFAVVITFMILLSKPSQASYSPNIQCGLRTFPSSRIVGGVTAKPGKWPWQVEILQPHGSSYAHRCGGTLIDAQWVVTAAHCVFKNPYSHYFKVIVGQYNRSVRDPGEMEFNVSSVRIHKSYMTSGYGFDIALLKLASPVMFNPSKVWPACLPKQGDRIPVGTECFITGWGKTSFNAPLSEVLQEAKMPVVSYSTCATGNANLYGKVDDNTMVCAGFGGNSTVSGCHGDSGGPFVCKESGYWVLRGAVSWGDHWCRAGSTYSVFVRISFFKDWITQTKNAAEFVMDKTCKDYLSHCTKWSKPTTTSLDGDCSSGWFKNYLKLHCPKSCGHCSSSGV